MNDIAAIKARREAANPETWGTARVCMALADIDTLLAHVAAITAERDALRAQLQQAQDAAKRQAAYISACVDSDGCYRP